VGFGAGSQEVVHDVRGDTGAASTAGTALYIVEWEFCSAALSHHDDSLSACSIFLFFSFSLRFLSNPSLRSSERSARQHFHATTMMFGFILFLWGGYEWLDQRDLRPMPGPACGRCGSSPGTITRQFTRTHALHIERMARSRSPTRGRLRSTFRRLFGLLSATSGSVKGYSSPSYHTN
jgi:hypothetical protein